jgi:ABC-type transporter Mla MlaB component
MSKPFELPEEMTIYSAVETRDALLAWVTEQGTKSAKLLEISAAKVREVDGSGLQLLASLAHMDQPWRLVEPSAALLEAGKTLGLEVWLDDQIANS